MTGQRRSTHLMVALFAVAVLGLSGNTAAQPPAPQSPRSPPATGTGAAPGPAIPSAPQAMPPVGPGTVAGPSDPLTPPSAFSPTQLTIVTSTALQVPQRFT